MKAILEESKSIIRRGKVLANRKHRKEKNLSNEILKKEVIKLMISSMKYNVIRREKRK